MTIDRHKRLESLLVLAILTGLFLLLGDSAYAATDGTFGTFSCSAGKASGHLYIAGDSCPTRLGTDNFFSFLICNMQELSSNVMGSIYCGVIDALTPMVWAAVTLSVTLFGVAFMAGITQLSRGSAILFLIKIAFVTGVALNADVLIDVGYRFFITGMNKGIEIVLTSFDPSITSGADVYKKLDLFTSKAFGMATDMLSGTLEKDLVKGEADRCKNAVFAALITMAIAFPMLAYLGLALLARIAMGVFSAAFGYIYALIGVTFLMILAPIFLCFYLFKQTQPFFDKWLGYMVSFSLQAVLLFTFMTFVLSIGAMSVPKSVLDVIVLQSKAADTQAFSMPWTYCTLCDFKVVDKDTGADMDYNADNFLTQGKLVCVDHSGEAGADSAGRLPIDFTYAMSPKAKSQQLGATINVGVGVILSLIILAWLVEHLLKLVPSIAQKLAGGMGATNAPQLGGGFTSYVPAATMPGEGLMGDFRDGFRYGYGSKGNTASGIVQGVKDGLSSMVTGKSTTGEAVKDTVGRPALGASNRFTDWLFDPAKFQD